jgi:Alpha amylase, catalytic domain
MNKLYQIHTRDFLFKISPTAKLKDVPVGFWQDLKLKGINQIYLLGVWSVCDFAHNLAKKSYITTASQTTVGSCFSIDDYTIDPIIATEQEFLDFKKMINGLEMNLVLDFIPNHFGCSTPLLDSNPEVFLKTTQPDLDSQFWFDHNGIKFLYGKDPNFGSWHDTVQVDYSNPKTHAFMKQKLEYIATMCDGVRCDMSMLVESEIFQRTWSNLLQRELPPYSSFWQTVIPKIKNLYPNFIFIAEVYWEMEKQMIGSGFDYVYNKSFLDYLIHQDYAKLQANLRYFNVDHCVYFLENHDENRSASTLEKSKISLCVVLLCFLGGIQFFYDQQWQGQSVRNPIQILESQTTQTNLKIELLYKNLLEYTQQSVFEIGKTKIMDTPFADLVAIIWEYKDQKTCVFINFGETKRQMMYQPQNQYVEQKNYQSDSIKTIVKHIIVQPQNLLIEIPPLDWVIVECW